MANVDEPRGFTPISNMNGSPYTGGTIKVAFEDENAVAAYVGDIVRLEGSADAQGNPTVDRFAAADTDAFGVIVSFEPDRTDLELKYRAASTARNAYVVPVGEQQLFSVQDDGTGTAAAGWVGNTVDINAGTGSTTTGRSALEIVGSDVGTGINCHIMGLLKKPGNTIAANAEWVVRITENSVGAADPGI